ncbi:Rap1a/Tai family immunity protein [Pararhizobium sp. BT-229]|uniref:Rap1a/Tai family immunity protein n=1 Tax=Pararhizobium sp. BT-229 TaxID=2986923 RepID=UPI0021F74349|nr:Rap1a/Tai family immunity protein [Pararhizobium sp. BT-229]MCV9965824.1 Rap1a/Tai family immunity protein [Pararhizobium sp. BT-229]
MKRLMLALAVGFVLVSTAEAQFMDADDLHTFCQQKHPVVVGYVAGVLDRWSRDLHHAEMSDVVDTENKRPKSKVPVTDKIRSNVCDPDTIPLEEQVNIVCAFVAANPKEHGRSADMLVQLAMQAKWPCTAQ